MFVFHNYNKHQVSKHAPELLELAIIIVNSTENTIIVRGQGGCLKRYSMIIGVPVAMQYVENYRLDEGVL